MSKAKKKDLITITSRDEADQALKRIGELQRGIASAEQDADTDITGIREGMLRETVTARVELDENIIALEAWARVDRKSWPAKSLELVFGSFGFRLPAPAIKLKLEVQNIIERLRGKKMDKCIRTTEEVDKDALANYDDNVLETVGCARTKPKEKFWCEPKHEEVK